jgi:two-component system CheB/CheR fusion protein
MSEVINTGPDPLQEKPDNFLVVGLGASAGGIQALQEFFSNVPADSGAAYVVILHLSPDHDSKLTEVLQSVSETPVTKVTEQVKVQPNHIYVVPPNQHLEMVDGSITVSENTLLEERRAPVDIFFRTLADSLRARAVAVILAGTGADGSMGLKRIKEHGGVVYVQNPREAEFNEMPRSAIATNLVDEILPVAQIPAKILAYQAHVGTIEIPVDADSRSEAQQRALSEIFALLRLRTGHDFSNYKRPTLLRRIERRINVYQLPSLEDYVLRLHDDPDESKALLKDLLISVTNFFRDKKAFDFIEQEILPRIFQDKKSEDAVRIWVAGCATGEEAYSLAMLCAEQIGDNIDGPQVQIFATDIHADALNAAREGLYTLNDAADVSPERLQRFFSKEGELYRIRRELREMVLFANHNVIKDPPFSRLDLVACRNLLIYLNPTAQERVIETFHFALHPGRWLFLGSSESVDGANDLFSPENREFHVFQSRHIAARSYPVPAAIPNFGTGAIVEAEARVQAKVNRPLERITYGDLHQQLVEQYAPPSLVVNEEYEIVHLSERAGHFLQVSGGEPSNNLLKLIRPELRLELRSALYQAANHKTNVKVRDLKFRSGEQTETVDIHVRPVLNGNDAARGFILVIFEPTPRSGGDEEVLHAGDEEVLHAGDEEVLHAGDKSLARRLEEELIHVKAQLRSSNEQHEAQAEELKASNEELQAMNEELRSTAEELETSKEELHAINEELTTVNQELKVRVEEVTITRNNLQNLINSTNIGTIFLDGSLRVHLFTPVSREIFNLIPTDSGRPLSDLTHRLEYDGLIEDAETVLETLQSVEREVRTTDGRFWMMRLSPYRTQEDRVNGVAITFFNITDRKQSEEVKHFLAAIVESSQDSVLTVNFDGIITSWNRAAQKLYGYTAEEAIGRSLNDIVLPQNILQVLANIDDIKHGHKVEVFDSVRVHKDGRNINLEVVMSPVRDDKGAVIGVSTIARDVTERRAIEAELRESKERFRILVEGAQDFAIFMLSADNIIMTWNSGAERITGFTEAEAVGRSGAIIFTPADRAAGGPEQEIQTAARDGSAPDERWHLRKSGELFWGSGVLMAVRGADGQPTSFVKIFRDATEQKQGAEALQASEARFRTLSDAVPQLVWTNNAAGEADYFNYRWYEYSGLTYEQSYGLGWQVMVHPDDAPTSIARWEQAQAKGEVFDTEYRLRRADGTYRWHIGRNVPLLNEQGQVLSWFGTATDIQELKDVQDALWHAHDEMEQRVTERTGELARITAQREQLLERVVNVQEDERRRISRDLHDMLGQQLTALLMGLQTLPKSPEPGPGLPSYPEHVEKLRSLTRDLIQQTQRLAWEVRPATLDNLGLRAALRQFVEEWSEQYGTTAHIVESNTEEMERLPEQVETALYRVVQEALTNVQRHAGASQVSVLLEKSTDMIAAIIEDNGKGFDIEKDERGQERSTAERLGLLGMAERMELVGGTLTIESSPGKGTTVYARVPSAPKSEA